MRSAIFVSLALAGSAVSFAASAGDARADYSDKIARLQTEYRAAVNKATNAYVEKTIYSVRVRNENLLDWNNSVNAAMVSYTKSTQATYDYYMSMLASGGSDGGIKGRVNCFMTA